MQYAVSEANTASVLIKLYNSKKYSGIFPLTWSFIPSLFN